MTAKVGSLFAGYEGIGLALEQVFPDVQLTWVSEFDTAPSKILATRYPDVPNHGDVTKIKWSPDCPTCGSFTRVRRSTGALRLPLGYTCSGCGEEHDLSLRQDQMLATGVEIASPVDVITGGSPCQDLSHAGKRAGMKAGTRSGLWASMCDAIDIIRPSLVIWENVRGALSAEATPGDLESCEFCVGDPGDASLRALGRVLGDLAELGYDAAWCSLRAADVGAPHGRYRVFVLAWPAADTDDDGWGEQLARGLAAAQPRVEDVTPIAGVVWGSPEWRDLTLLKTPTSQLAVNGGSQHPDKRKAGGHGPTLADEVEYLMPTPTTAPSTGNGHARNLGSEAQLMPTPRASDGTKGGPNQRGSSGDLMLPSAVTHLMPTPSVADATGGHANRSGARSNELLLPGLVRTLMPTPRATRGGSGTETMYGLGAERSDDDRPQGQVLLDRIDFGAYGPAVDRWERALGRPAPSPTEPTGKAGAQRLSPRFVEWMMGLPLGWVTDVDITRNEQLKALGNGVVPQQAAAAIRYLFGVRAASLGLAA